MKDHYKLVEVFKYTIIFSGILYIANSANFNPFADKLLRTGDVFLIDPEKELHQGRHTMALSQCNDAVEGMADVGQQADFGNQDYKAWNLSSGRYLIKAKFLFTSDSGDSVVKNYTCRTRFFGGDHNDLDNWEIQGIKVI